MLGGLPQLAGLIPIGLLMFLESGCVSQSAYQAKVDELERLRSREQIAQAQLVERFDRLSARMGELEKQLGQSDARLSEMSRSVQLMRDLTVQIDQNVRQNVRPVLQDVHCEGPARDSHKPEPSAPRNLRDPFFRSKPRR